jgi:PAS domain S-box-containing protein
MASKFLEHALWESQARLCAMLNLMQGAIALFDLDGRLLMRGGPLAGLWGDRMPAWPPQAEHGWRGFDAGGEVLALVDYPELRALRGETVTPGLHFIHTDAVGLERSVRVSAAPYRNEGGDIAGAIAMLEDGTEDGRPSRRKQKVEARLKAAVDLIGLGLYSWNPVTNEVKWNDAARAIWGLPTHAKGDFASWRSAIHPDDIAVVDDALRRSLDPETDGVYDVEHRIIGHGDGVERWVATRGLTSFADGQAVAFNGVVIDITERKRAERAMEERVEERTRELEALNQQLHKQIERREAAEAAAQQLQRLNAIGQITSGIVHDFNNLVAVVLTNVKLLQRSIRDRDEREGLELIRAAAERGAKVTAQLLAYARKQRLAPQRVDLNARIIGMTDLLRATLGRNIQLKVELAFFTTKSAGQGSGLGLAQVFGVLKQSDGGVSIDTRIGEGTSVTVFLPIVRTSAGN